MGAIEDYAQSMRDLASRSGLRRLRGTVAEVVDAQHVRVSVGDRTVIAFGAAPVGAAVSLLVGDGACELIGSTGGSLPHAMAAGTVSLTFSGAPASASVTFPPGRFSVAPNVMATLLGTTGLGITTSVTDVTATGCTVRGSSSYTGTVSVAWQAVQMTSSSATG